MDLLNATGDPALATQAADLLAAAGIGVGTVTSEPVPTSAVDHPAAQRDPAIWLAQQMGMPSLAQVATVERVTLVLGAQDAAAVLTGLKHLPSAACPTSTAPSG